MTLRSLGAFAALALALLGAPATVAQEASALASDGLLYTLRVAPAEAEASGGTLLLLEIQRPDQAATTVVVPGTEDAAVELAPSLVAPEGSETVYLLWQSRSPGFHSALHLQGYAAGTWSAATEIVAGPWSAKSAPQMVVTADRIANPDNSGSFVRRTILHVLWAEELAAGGYDAYYAPVVLIENRLTQAPTLYRLADLDNSAVANLSFDLAPAFLQAPRIELGRDARAVTITFAQAERRRITSLEVDVLPDELVRLASEARSGVIIFGVKGGGTRAKLADELAALVQSRGQAFLPEFRDSLALELRRLVSETPEKTLDVVADEARSGVIIFGSRNRDRGLARAAESLHTLFGESAPVSSNDPASPGSGDGTVLRFSIATSRLAFRIGAGEVRLMSSADASRTLVAWWDAQTVHYRISAGNGWSEQAEIQLGARMSLDRALDVLRKRVRPQ